MPEEDLNAIWHEKENEITELKEQLKSVKEALNKALDELVHINERLYEERYAYNFKNHTWEKQEPEIIYGYQYKIYVNGELKGIINDDNGTNQITIPSEWFKVGDTIEVEPAPITEPIVIYK